MTKPLPYSAGRPSYARDVVVTYQGEATIYGPSASMPAGTTVEHLTCGHRHQDIDTAQDCGRRLAKRTVAARNKAAAVELAQAVCDIQANEVDRDDSLWLKFCAGHHTRATRLHNTAELALADAWTCPWATS